jgi:phosphopantothenoylcysteine decarboxylase/phosphopantothenate--cysteine ligase
VVVCPATADLLAKMAAGIADDLATTLLLATDTPVLAVPAMNVRMWQHAATRRNVAQLEADGIAIMQPDEGSMACGEFGPGRLPQPDAIHARIAQMLEVRDPLAGQGAFDAAPPHRPLYGRHLLVTAGPTHEAIDPVRYIANRSSGKQGFAIAEAGAAAGARVTLVAGPVALAPRAPPGVERIDVESAEEMAQAVEAALPADCAIMVAAVADWRARAASTSKIKKEAGGALNFDLVQNPDILASLAAAAARPQLLIGFAAETEDVLARAADKRVRKGADWIVANDVSGDAMGGADNEVHLVRAEGIESWPRMSKQAVAARLVEAIARELAKG